MMHMKVKFSREEDGLSLTEGVITFPIMILVVTAAVEFIFGMYQWNIANKAMHLAARRIAVSAPFTSDFNTVFGDPEGAVGGATIPPDASVISTCGAGTQLPCNANAMEFLVGPHDVPVSDNWFGLSSYYPQLDPSTIRITYQRNGLGFVDRPAGPVTTVRLEFDNASFNLPVLSVLLNFANISLPPFVVSITTEDLSNCPFSQVPDSLRDTNPRCDWGTG